jgi:hypothetical protein
MRPCGKIFAILLPRRVSEFCNSRSILDFLKSVAELQFHESVALSGKELEPQGVLKSVALLKSVAHRGKDVGELFLPGIGCDRVESRPTGITQVSQGKLSGFGNRGWEREPLGSCSRGSFLDPPRRPEIEPGCTAARSLWVP